MSVFVEDNAPLVVSLAFSTGVDLANSPMEGVDVGSTKEEQYRGFPVTSYQIGGVGLSMPYPGVFPYSFIKDVVSSVWYCTYATVWLTPNVPKNEIVGSFVVEDEALLTLLETLGETEYSINHSSTPNVFEAPGKVAGFSIPSLIGVDSQVADFISKVEEVLYEEVPYPEGVYSYSDDDYFDLPHLGFPDENYFTEISIRHLGCHMKSVIEGIS